MVETLPTVFLYLSIASYTSFSFILSRADVASSSRIIGVSFKIALAIEILCFWPPDNLIPFSPIIVS